MHFQAQGLPASPPCLQKGWSCCSSALAAGQGPRSRLCLLLHRPLKACASRPRDLQKALSRKDHFVNGRPNCLEGRP